MRPIWSVRYDASFRSADFLSINEATTSDIASSCGRSRFDNGTLETSRAVIAN